MLKTVENLRLADPYFAGSAGFLGSTLEDLYADVSSLDLPPAVPLIVRRAHDAARHAYIYSYYSYDLITLAAAETFPCLELALRERLGAQFIGRLDRRGRHRPAPALDELLKAAKAQGLVSADIEHLAQLRNMFAHGSEAVLSPPMFLPVLKLVTGMVGEMFAER